MNTPNATSSTITHTATLTHSITDGTQDVALFDSAETATRFVRDGETVERLKNPVTRNDCRKLAGGGFGVW